MKKLTQERKIKAMEVVLWAAAIAANISASNKKGVIRESIQIVKDSIEHDWPIFQPSNPKDKNERREDY